MCHPLQLAVPDHILSRYDHSITAVPLTPHLTEVTLFGGCTRNDKSLSYVVQGLAATTVITFGKSQLTRI